MGFPSGINSIMAQFDIDPYHWPGWIHATLSAAVSVTVLLFFMETRSLSRAKCSSAMRCTCLARLKLSAQLHSKWKVRTVSSHYYCIIHYIAVHCVLTTACPCLVGSYIAGFLKGHVVHAGINRVCNLCGSAHSCGCVVSGSFCLFIK